MPTVAFKTLGCRLNQAETDRMAEDLIASGYEVVAEDAHPDVVIVNTCTVTKEATSGSRRTVRNAAASNPGSLVFAAGCYAVAEPTEARSIPGVGGVITNDEKERIAEILGRHFQPEVPSQPKLIGLGPSPGVSRTRVNFKVQTGCDEFCTFCIIPKTRGPLRSFPVEVLLRDARRKVDEGARELVLTGVHLGKYGWDAGRPDDSLLELLEGLLAIEELRRIRLSSILSRHVTDSLVGLISKEERLCRFLHIPLQSGDDSVLRRMNRPYRIDEYLEAVARVKDQIPGIGLSTDVIVGFPGETEDQFEKTCEVVEHVGFLKLHVFRYSPRDGTPSATWDQQVAADCKKARSKRLIELGSRLRSACHDRQVGLSREVFVEDSFENGELVGHTDDFVKVRFAGLPSAVGGLARVLIEESSVECVRGTFQREVPWHLSDPRGL